MKAKLLAIMLCTLFILSSCQSTGKSSEKTTEVTTVKATVKVLDKSYELSNDNEPISPTVIGQKTYELCWMSFYFEIKSSNTKPFDKNMFFGRIYDGKQLNIKEFRKLKNVFIKDYYEGDCYYCKVTTDIETGYIFFDDEFNPLRFVDSDDDFEVVDSDGRTESDRKVRKLFKKIIKEIDI